MSFTAASNLSSLTLGKLLKILSKGAVYNQLSAATEAWDLVKKIGDADAEGREYRYEVMTSYGPAAVQATGYGPNAKFPAGQRSTVVEATAQYKDFDLTVEYDLTLEDKAGAELIAYAKPLAHELMAKTTVAGRISSAWLFGDGSGAIGCVATSGVSVSTSGDYIDITLNTTSAKAGRSHIGWFEFGDKVKFASAAGVAHNTINNTGSTVAYWLVTDVNQDTDVARLKPYDSSGSLIDITTATLGATDPTAADYIYRLGTTANDLTSYDAALATYDANTLSEVMVGLEALAANDGRLVNGLTMSGTTGGSLYDASGNLLSADIFNSALLRGMRRTGGMTDGKKITFSKAWMHDRVLRVALQQAEANRQFFNVQDVNTGVSSVGHKFRKMMIGFESCEFVPVGRVWMLPDVKGPIEFAGRDYKDVTLGGKGLFLKPSTSDGQYYKQGQKFMSGSGVLAARHPAALIGLTNFSVSVN